MGATSLTQIAEEGIQSTRMLRMIQTSRNAPMRKMKSCLALQWAHQSPVCFTCALAWNQLLLTPKLTNQPKDNLKPMYKDCDAHGANCNDRQQPSQSIFRFASVGRSPRAPKAFLLSWLLPGSQRFRTRGTNITIRRRRSSCLFNSFSLQDQA